MPAPFRRGGPGCRRRTRSTIATRRTRSTPARSGRRRRGSARRGATVQHSGSADAEREPSPEHAPGASGEEPRNREPDEDPAERVEHHGHGERSERPGGDERRPRPGAAAGQDAARGQQPGDGEQRDERVAARVRRVLDEGRRDRREGCRHEPGRPAVEHPPEREHRRHERQPGEKRGEPDRRRAVPEDASPRAFASAVWSGWLFGVE